MTDETLYCINAPAEWVGMTNGRAREWANSAAKHRRVEKYAASFMAWVEAQRKAGLLDDSMADEYRNLAGDIAYTANGEAGRIEEKVDAWIEREDLA